MGKLRHVSSATSAEDITPSGGDVTTDATRAVYVGGAGDLKVDFRTGGTVTLEGVVAGSILDISITKVYDTGTTATNVLALR